MRDTNEPGLNFHPASRRVVRFGPFRADLADGSLWRGAEEVRMPPRALAVLLYLVERPGRVVTKAALLDAVWKDAHVSETSLTEAMGIVRQTLGDSSQQPVYIQTVHRRGYRFIAPLSVEPQAGMPRAVPDGPAEPGSAPADLRVATGRRERPGSRRRLVLAVAAAVLAAGMGTAAWIWIRPDPARAITRATITLPADQAPAPVLGAHTVMALSPDGQEMVYVAGTSGDYRLFARRMDQFEARPIPGTAGAHGPFFSPDGLRIGFFADGNLKHLALAGGEPVTAARAPGGLGASWTDRRTIVFAPDWSGGVWEVDDRGGEPREIVKAPAPAVGYRWPQLLPDGVTIVATRWKSDTREAAVVALSGSRPGETVLAEGATYGRYLPTRHLLFVRETTLFAAHYAPGDARTRTERPVLERVMTGSTGAAQFSFSGAAGSLIYIPHDPDRALRAMVRVDAAGRLQPTAHESRAFQNLSVCGTRIAVTILERGTSDLWTASVSGGAFTRLTNTGAVIEPVWRPGCEEIAYSRGNEMYLQRADGSEPARRIQASAMRQAPASWSPDGTALIYVQVTPEAQVDVWMVSLADGKRQPLLVSPASESSARVSPDGRWLAYQSSETGGSEIYIRPFQRRGGAARVSVSGGTAPVWSPDGRLLYYRSRNQILALPISGSGVGAEGGGHAPADPAIAVIRPLDTGGFLAIQRIREHHPLTTLNLVINWTEEIAQRLAR